MRVLINISSPGAAQSLALGAELYLTYQQNIKRIRFQCCTGHFITNVIADYVLSFILRHNNNAFIRVYKSKQILKTPADRQHFSARFHIMTLVFQHVIVKIILVGLCFRISIYQRVLLPAPTAD